MFSLRGLFAGAPESSPASSVISTPSGTLLCPAPEANVLFLSGLNVGGAIAEAEAGWFDAWFAELLRIHREQGKRVNVITVRYGSARTIASAARAALSGLDPSLPLSIVGYSLGGMVAQEALVMATRLGFPVRCAILIATTAPILPHELAAELAAEGAEARGRGEDAEEQNDGEGEEQEERGRGEDTEKLAARRDRALLLRGFALMMSPRRPRCRVASTLRALLDLVGEDPRGAWALAKVEETGVLDAPSRELLDQLRAATRWVLGWDADSLVSARALPATPPASAARVVVVAPELDQLFPAEIHAERIRRRLSEQGFSDVEVLRLAGSGHGKSDIFTPEDGAAYVNGCGRLSLLRTARILSRAHPSLAIVASILAALALVALVGAVAGRRRGGRSPRGGSRNTPNSSTRLR